MKSILVYDETAVALESLAESKDTTIAEVVEEMLDWQQAMSKNNNKFESYDTEDTIYELMSEIEYLENELEENPYDAEDIEQEIKALKKRIRMYKNDLDFCDASCDSDFAFAYSKFSENNSRHKTESFNSNFIMYKGFDITYGLYGKGEYSVEYCGDDILFNSEDEAKEFIDSIVDVTEATNCGSIGQHKRDSIDLIDSSRFDVDDEDCGNELLVEIDDNSIEDSDEVEEIDDEIDDSDIIDTENSVDGKDSTTPMNDMQSKKSGSKEIDM